MIRFSKVEAGTGELVEGPGWCATIPHDHRARSAAPVAL